jgi:ABC-2 type transport system ATP-binding protein
MFNSSGNGTQKVKTAISLKNVSKAFVDRKAILPAWMLQDRSRTQVFAVRNVSFDVKHQEIFGVLGPNGCGKSTLIRMISTLLIPDQGTIKVFGMDVVEKPAKIKKIINRVSVEASFFKTLSAKENLLYAGRLYGLTPHIAEKRFRFLLQELGFPKGLINKPMYKFSRGLQQKVAIARGFLTEPDILLLDEPTTGLDPKSKLEVQRFIRKIREERGTTVIITSHDMEEVDRLCDRIAIMDRGRIVAMGTSQELKRLVQDKEVYEIETSNSQKALKLVKQAKAVTQAENQDGKVRFLTSDIDKAMNQIMVKLKRNKIRFKGLHKLVPTLEDVFLKLTGRTLEDEDENTS